MKKIQKLIDSLCLMDDDFMSWAFEENYELTEYFLHMVLPNLYIKIEKIFVQKQFKNLFGGDIRIDVLALNENGEYFDIEIQRAGTKEEIFRRARYYAGLLDCRENVDEDYRKLKDKYIIFYTERDIMGLGKPFYASEHYIEGIKIDDGLHMIYVNNSYNGNDDFGKMNHDFRCSNYNDMYDSIIRNTVKRMKTEEKSNMCEKMEKFKAEIQAEALAQGEAKTKIETAVNLFKNNVSIEIIAKSLNLTIAELEDILKNNGCLA